VWDAEEELAADARHDRDDHDGEHYPGDENAARLGRAAEERQEAEGAVQPRLDVVGEEGAEHQNPPEPEDDARNRRQQLDERTDDEPQATRCQLAQEERDREREGRRDHERDQRRHRRPEEAGGRAEQPLVRVPGGTPDEREAECAQREVGPPNDLVGDQADQGDRREPRRERQQDEQTIAEPVANPSPAAQLLGDGHRAHRRAR
jgi:hypothetical protein